MKNIVLIINLMLLIFINSNLYAADSYYVMVGGERTGPNSIEKLNEMKLNGQLSKESLVWSDGMAEWAKAGDQMALQSLFVSIPPPPPPMPVSAVVPPPPPSLQNNQRSIGQSDIQDQNKMSDPKTIISASDSIDEWADNAVKNFGRAEGEFGEKNGKFILFASQPVSIKSTDPQYGDAMINAFDKALTKIQEQYVMTRFGKTITEKSKSFFSDRSTNAKELKLPEPSDPNYINKFLALFEKSLDVADKRLNKELIAMGESPSKIESIPLKIKKDLFRDKFLKSTLRKASGSISGLFPIQTAVVKDKKGKTLVGVIAIASTKTIQVAKDIKLQRNSLVKGKGRDITSLLPAKKEDFIHTFGTRLVYDIDGTPAIISYGISSYRPDTDDDYINDELKSESKSDSVSNADAQIAEIINGHMNVNNERKRGEEIKKILERELKANSEIIEKNIKNIIKITNNSTKSSASAKLQGISTVKTWNYTAKEGQKYVGAVRVWKYSTLKAIKDFNDSEYSNKPKTKHQYKSSIKSSAPVNSMDDF